MKLQKFVMGTVTDLKFDMYRLA